MKKIAPCSREKFRLSEAEQILDKMTAKDVEDSRPMLAKIFRGWRK